MDAIVSGGGIGRPILVYTVVMVIGQAILAGLGFAFPDFEMPGSFGLLINVMAALIAGQSFAKAWQREMTKGEQVRFGLVATLITLALVAATFIGIFAYFGVPLTVDNFLLVLTGDASVAREFGGWIWVILGVAVLVTYAVCRFGVGSGAKGYLKKQAKLAAR